jgi:hypothetical protein
MATPGIEFYTPKRWHSQSSLMTASKCLRRYFYEVGCRLRHYDANKTAAIFGQAIHYGIPKCYESDVNGAMSLFNEVWDSEDVQADDKRNPMIARKIFEDLAKNHCQNCIYKVENPNVGIEIEDKISDQEVAFAIDVGVDIPLVGRIDALGRHKQTGALWPVDYKTTSRLSAGFLKGHECSPQVMCYTLGVRSLTNEQVPGTIIVGIKVAKTTQGAQTHLCYIEDHHIERFIKWVQRIHAQIRACEEKEEWPENWGACATMFSCPYKPLCEMKDWTAMKSLYRCVPEIPFKIGPENENQGNVVHAGN